MKSYFPIVALFCLLACKDNNPSSGLTVCNVKDPVRNLPWLSDLIEEAKKTKQADILTVSAVEIGQEMVFNYSLSYMACIGCVSYHCDGSRLDISKYTQEELQKYRNNIYGENGKRIILWPEK